MMSVKDFCAGQTAYNIKYRKGGKNEDFDIRAVEVSRVGRKYVRIAGGSYENEFYNRRGNDEYLSEDRVDGMESRLFPTKELAMQDFQKSVLRKSIFRMVCYENGLEHLTLEQLNTVFRCLKEGTK